MYHKIKKKEEMVKPHNTRKGAYYDEEDYRILNSLLHDVCQIISE